MLQNRINRLIIEEEKAAKRISETRRRAKEIWELKRRNEVSQAARADAGLWMSGEHHLQRQLLTQARSERSAALDLSKAALQHMRKEEVSVMRQVRREKEEAVVSHRNMELARCVARKAAVKRQQNEVAMRCSRERELQFKQLQEQRRQARTVLNDDTGASMRQYHDLAIQELSLLKSLAVCQKQQMEQQQMAYAQLEAVVERPSPVCLVVKQPSTAA